MKKETLTHTIDASGKILGRLAVDIAVFLRGKQKVAFLPYIEPTDQVIVFNAEKIKVTGKKMAQKLYRTHSLYPGGLKEKKLEVAFKNNPSWVLKEAVYGMLPKYRTRNKIIKNLKIYNGEIK